MAAKRGLKHRLQQAVRKRLVKPRPQSIPTGNVRSDRWGEITTHHTDLLEDVEGSILETQRYVTGLCDHWTHLGLIGAMRDDLPEHPCSIMLFQALKNLRQQREDVDDELWLDALRVVDQSVRDHSSLRHGDRTYLSFIGAFFGEESVGDDSRYQVTHERIPRPVLAGSPTGEVVIGFAWYRRDQWPLLRSVAADYDKLEETYDEWAAVVDKTVADLRCKGVRAKKVDIDVDELLTWCKQNGCRLDGQARGAFVSEKLRDDA